jgi:hypothetical protein
VIEILLYAGAVTLGASAGLAIIYLAGLWDL